MPQASFSHRRERLRAVIARGDVTSPGSVFDATSARLASTAGYEYGLLGGSIASHTVLAAPDLMVLTLTEFVEQVKRMSRACELPVIVDADHGYGNALNARRTVEELEAAGVGGLTIEDTVLPRPYASSGRPELYSPEEFRDKLRACIDARIDPGVLIIGRTMHRDRDETLRRVRACVDAGVDMIFVNGRVDLPLLDAVRNETMLPLIVSRTKEPVAELQARGVRVLYQGHEPFFVALNALLDAYRTLRDGGSPDDLRVKALSPEMRDVLFASKDYARFEAQYLDSDPGAAGPS